MSALVAEDDETVRRVNPAELDKIKARALDAVALKMAWVESERRAPSETRSPGVAVARI